MPFRLDWLVKYPLYDLVPVSDEDSELRIIFGSAVLLALMPSLLLLLKNWHQTFELELARTALLNIDDLEHQPILWRIANGSATCAIGAFTLATKLTEEKEIGPPTILCPPPIISWFYGSMAII